MENPTSLLPQPLQDLAQDTLPTDEEIWARYLEFQEILQETAAYEEASNKMINLTDKI